MTGQLRFNTPPEWPPPPEGWVPPEGWRPDPSWPPAPPGWAFWVPAEAPPAPPTDTPTDPAPDATPAESDAAASNDPSDVPPTAPSGGDRPEEAPVNSDPSPGPAPESTELAATRAELEQALRELEQVRAQLTQARTQSAAAAAGASTRTAGSVEEVNADIEKARRELVELNDAVLLQQVGIYEYHHPLENAEAYKQRLAELRTRIKDTVRAKDAVVASDRFAYNNSLAAGRKMTADLSKLMLRAYKAEADNCVRSLRAGSIHAAIKRLDKAVESIARLGSMMEMRVSPDYHALRIEELELTSDYLFKVQEEREAAREERERLREERRAEQELAAERERLAKERSHYANALAAMRGAAGTPEELADLEARLTQIDSAIEQNDYRAANIRAGYVYVISNIGAFGPDVVKIGMTRRLEPFDRVRELGDASVPFPFDVHAIYFSDDAVQLENELHAAFGERRMNRVNLRREFFFANPSQVRDVLKTKVGNLLEFTEEPEATQYFQSHAEWPVPAGGA